jgi:mevalonate kinase
MLKTYPAKILLFGEYSIIQGSAALAIPYRDFYGQWKTEKNHDSSLVLFQQYCEQHSFDFFDYHKFKTDLNEGLYFSSTIPQGHGIGSSGALIAGLYDRFGNFKNKSLLEVKAELAKLETFYHGQSSGIDPLVSWLDKSLIIHQSLKVDVIEMPLFEWREAKKWFLLETGISRSSSPLVTLFKEQMSSDDSAKEKIIVLKEFVGLGIEYFLNFDLLKMDKLMIEISRFQYEFFKHVIPQNIKDYWLHGLNSETYALKLCGAGGGGYFLGYRLSEKALDHHPLPILHF